MATDSIPCTLPLSSSPLVAEMRQLLDVGRISPPRGSVVLKGFVNNRSLDSDRARRRFLYNVLEILDDVVVNVTVNFEMPLQRAAEIEANGQARNDPGNSDVEGRTEHLIVHNILPEWSLCVLLLTCLPRAYAALWQRAINIDNRTLFKIAQECRVTSSPLQVDSARCVKQPSDSGAESRYVVRVRLGSQLLPVLRETT
ncbi:hypothetical protein CYMTET_35728 [Cymbomonas tetramitiformis]|uniref:Uncharacterized protein n=1 Tax=Cymbomonas tetramitiformis TaxID=36881 RepID=A0AAE0F8P1_9CHLO|nr:hypothetical protein CYMTET_35728 [Cymbomonas tetramitiformis]|eukprot:gene188-329_t